MSYILDALKKADAARERESVPGLHSRHDHPAAPEPDDGSAEGLSPKATWAMGCVLGGVVLAALMAWWMQPEPMPTAPQAQTQMQQQPSRIAQAVAVAPVATTLPAAPAAPTATVAPVAPITPVTPALPAARVSPVAPVSTPALPASAPRLAGARAAPSGVAPEPAPVRRPAPAATSLSVDPALRDAPPPVVPIDRLPDDIRRELPALSVGGAMHSDVAANRMLILNGGVFREGDQPAPGVMLEEIKLKSAVFRYKGHRYSVSY